MLVATAHAVNTKPIAGSRSLLERTALPFFSFRGRPADLSAWLGAPGQAGYRLLMTANSAGHIGD